MEVGIPALVRWLCSIGCCPHLLEPRWFIVHPCPTQKDGGSGKEDHNLSPQFISGSYLSHLLSHPIAWNLVMWPQLTAKEGEKCSISSGRSLLGLKFRDSIAMREKGMQNIGKQLAAFSTAGNHNIRQQVSSWCLRGGSWKRCHKRGNIWLSIEGWIGAHWVKSDQRALQAGALA